MRALNSHDEWSDLKEVVVGSAENYLSHNRDLSFETFFHENLYRSDWAYPRLKPASPDSLRPRSRIAEKYVAELNEDVEAFAATLVALGVEVHRPLSLAHDAPSIRGFGWEAPPVPALNIRDNTIIFGNEIVETPPAIRSRYLETRLLSPIYKMYFDRGARWTTMPRPILNDSSFDLSYASDPETTLGGPTEPVTDPEASPYDVGYEMMLDGAQCLRLGRDVIVNVANENHAAGLRWLERHLSDRYRFHQVDRMSDNHIDSMLLALRPGAFLARHAGIRDIMPKEFRNWDYIVPPEPDLGAFPTYDDADLVLTSPYIDLNVLSISPQRVVANKDCAGVIRTLEAAGFEVVPVRHRHRRLFGGGFHCFTLDTVRAGTLEDYTI
jgi:glycine amidinotransferase